MSPDDERSVGCVLDGDHIDEPREASRRAPIAKGPPAEASSLSVRAGDVASGYLAHSSN
jgi:hypothetical protein